MRAPPFSVALAFSVSLASSGAASATPAFRSEELGFVLQRPMGSSAEVELTNETPYARFASSNGKLIVQLFDDSLPVEKDVTKNPYVVGWTEANANKTWRRIATPHLSAAWANDWPDRGSTCQTRTTARARLVYLVTLCGAPGTMLDPAHADGQRTLDSFELIEPGVRTYRDDALGVAFTHPARWKVEVTSPEKRTLKKGDGQTAGFLVAASEGAELPAPTPATADVYETILRRDPTYRRASVHGGSEGGIRYLDFVWSTKDAVQGTMMFATRMMKLRDRLLVLTMLSPGDLDPARRDVAASLRPLQK